MPYCVLTLEMQSFFRSQAQAQTGTAPNLVGWRGAQPASFKLRTKSNSQYISTAQLHCIYSRYTLHLTYMCSIAHTVSYMTSAYVPCTLPNYVYMLHSHFVSVTIRHTCTVFFFVNARYPFYTHNSTLSCRRATLGHMHYIRNHKTHSPRHFVAAVLSFFF